MIQQILIVGGGSAGFVTAIALKTRMPGLAVRVVRSRDIGIIGVGESTTVPVMRILHGYLKLDPATFYREVAPVWKMGIRFLWGPRPWFDYAFGSNLDTNISGLARQTGFYVGDDFADVSQTTALMSRNKSFALLPNGRLGLHRFHAYHLENKTFVAWLERHARRLGVEVVDGTIGEVQQDEHGVSGLVLGDGRKLSADLYVDCSGFRSLLLGKTLGEPFISFKSSLFNDRAVIGGWERRNDEPIQPYTLAETMDAGWCWRIDHETLINRGYVYSSAFISDEAAEREFRAKNPLAENIGGVKFITGRYERNWVKNVVALGNASGFVEPLESTGIGAFCTGAQILAETLAQSGQQPSASMIRLFNAHNARYWDGIRQFLAIHFKFNQRLETPYWRACLETADLAGAEAVVEHYKENGPTSLLMKFLLDSADIFDPEGYFAMLVGMKLPYENVYVPSTAEQERWAFVRRTFRENAERAPTTEQALAAVKRPTWQWNAEGY